MNFSEWQPEFCDPDWIPERAAEFAKEVGPDAVLLKLCMLVVRGQIEARFFWHVNSMLKPGPHEVPPELYEQ